MVARYRVLCRQPIGLPLTQTSLGSGNGVTRTISPETVGTRPDLEGSNRRRLPFVNGHDRAMVGTDATIGSWVLTGRGRHHAARWVSVLV